jgi:ankyrin repeat protein
MFPNPHDALPLPPRPNLDQYRKLAKGLLKAAQSQDAEALHTWAVTWIASLARLYDSAKEREGREKNKEERRPENSVILSEVEAQRSSASTQSKDPYSNLNSNPPKKNPLENFAHEKLSEKPTLTAAQFVLARAHGFESWPKLARHIEATIRANSPVNHFEQAADAIITGDKTMLAHLLKKFPDLVRAHSTRRHQATLLHYTAANGIEDYRQKTPKNIVEITKLLLDAGAEVNAIADLYGGSTTVSLMATSIHPERAGVQNALLQLLVNHGATIDEPNSPMLLINACLANGRPAAANFLADLGAKLDLEAAAGLGRLDLVKEFLDGVIPSGAALPAATGISRSSGPARRPNTTQLSRERALAWACEYGHNPVVNFLLDQGVPIQSQANTGQSPLHWAVIGRQKETVTLLLSRGADPQAKNTYGGTALGQALWSAAHADNPAPYQEIAALLKRHGAKGE